MQEKIKYIDSLRGLAILGVILVHSGQVSGNLPMYLKNITDQGARGVQLFFMLSALTLFISLSRRKTTILEFFIKRFFRIAPLFYLAIIFYTFKNTLFYYLNIGLTEPVDFFNVISTFLFFSNSINPYWINGVVQGGWSISVEMIFYLFVPFLFKVLVNLKRAIIFTIVAFVFSTFITLFLSHSQLISDKDIWNIYLFYWFPNQISIFGLGIVMYFLLKDTTDIQSKINGKISLYLLFSSLFFMIVLTQLDIPKSPIHFLYGLLFLILTLGLSKNQLALLVNKYTIYIGKISFSMYLTHFIVIESLIFLLDKVKSILNFNLNSIITLIVVYIITVLITVIISKITYKYVEDPGIKLGSKLIKKKNKNKNLINQVI